LEDAKLLAKHTIINRYTEDNQCPWKSGVSYGTTITMYDFDGNPNEYAFNLVQNNKPAGYILVNANFNAPGVEEISYDDSFYLDKMLNQNFKSDKSFTNMDKKIYYLGAFSFLIRNIESGKEVLYDASTKKKINIEKDVIKTEYKNNLKKRVDEKAKSLLENLKLDKLINNISMSNTINIQTSNAITSNSQIIYYKYDVPNLSYTHFYTTNETMNFLNVSDNCSPTAALTLIDYWYAQRSVYGLIPGTMSLSNTYKDLYTDMNTNNGHTGTYPSDIYHGILNYATWIGRPATGSDFVNYPTFARMQEAIAGGVPYEIDIRNNGTYRNHSMDVFGTELDNDGEWCRVADGWSTSYQTWYHYEYLNPIDMLYGRWN
jgi:hypothetical protein